MPRILIADDEPNIREVISFALERAGFAVTVARNGVEALQQFRRGSVDLIILDIGMPEMDGLEVCRQIRKSSDVPILFLSARDEEIDRVLGLEIGGGAGEIWDVYVGGAGRRATVTSSQRAALLGWLAATDGVSDMQAGPLMDVWYDGVPASPAAA